MLDEMRTDVIADKQNSTVTLEVEIAYAVMISFVCRNSSDVLHVQQALIEDIQKPYAPDARAFALMDWEGDDTLPQTRLFINLKQRQLLVVLNELEEGSIAVFGKGFKVLKGGMEQ
jgi:hypothetical protein